MQLDSSSTQGAAILTNVQNGGSGSIKPPKADYAGGMTMNAAADELGVSLTQIGTALRTWTYHSEHKKIGLSNRSVLSLKSRIAASSKNAVLKELSSSPTKLQPAGNGAGEFVMSIDNQQISEFAPKTAFVPPVAKLASNAQSMKFAANLESVIDAAKSGATGLKNGAIETPKHISVFQSHDGYPDEDDNGAMIGAAAFLKNAAKNKEISQTAMIYGDTKDVWRKSMLDPKLGTGDKKRGQANYNFFKASTKAIDQLGYRNRVFDTTPENSNGFKGDFKGASSGAKALAADIARSIMNVDEAGKPEPGRVSVYIAGGGQNVAAEAIRILEKRGISKNQILNKFAVIQHSEWNYQAATEPQAQLITKPYTIFISDQNETLGHNKKLSNIYGTSPIAQAWNEGVDAGTTRNNERMPKGRRDVSDAGMALFVADAYQGNFGGKPISFKEAFANPETRNWNAARVKKGGWNPNSAQERAQGRVLFLDNFASAPDPAGLIKKQVQNAISGAN